MVIEHLIKNLDKNASVLDFGCGTGVLSFELAKQGYAITSIDLDFAPVNILKEHIEYPDNITFLQDDIFNIDFEANKFDCIIALDVLEHIPIDKLPEFLAKFDYLLKKSGTVIVSGPTENFLYKLGRKLAGNDFTGHYHETTIGKIKEVFSKRYKVITLKKLIWPLTLFEIFYVNKS